MSPDYSVNEFSPLVGVLLLPISAHCFLTHAARGFLAAEEITGKGGERGDTSKIVQIKYRDHRKW